MKRIKGFILLICIASMSTMYAQVTIGSGIKPEKASLLEIKTQQATNPVSVNDDTNITSTKGGLGLPRVMLVNKETLEPFVVTTDTEWTNATTSKIKEKHAGLMVYNIKISPDTETDANKIFKQGVYIWNGSRWMQETKDDTRYFFIPSFNIALTAASTNNTCDLYAQYASQFKKAGNATFVSSNSSITTIPSPKEAKLYAKNELDYVITYYDTNILENVTLDANGVMTYDVKSTDTTPDSFLNVVFIIK